MEFGSKPVFLVFANSLQLLGAIIFAATMMTDKCKVLLLERLHIQWNNVGVWLQVGASSTYRKTSSIIRTKCQNLIASRVLQWSLPNPLEPCVKSSMKM